MVITPGMAESDANDPRLWDDKGGAVGNADMHCYECSVHPLCELNMRQTTTSVQ